MICIYEEQVYTNGSEDIRRVVIHADTTPQTKPLNGVNVEGLADAAKIAPASLMHCVDTGKNWFMNESMTEWLEDGGSNT